MKRTMLALTMANISVISVVWFGWSKVTGTEVPPPPTPMTEAVRLFSLYYGEAANEVGVHIPEEPKEGEGMEGEVISGPSRFTVAQDGTFYFADAVNDKIKQFDRKGQLLRQITTTLPYINDLAVASDGYVYVYYYDGSPRFEVFDSQGKSQPKIAKQMTDAVRAVDPEITLIALRTDAKGNLYGQAS